jgi:single-strand DNA-binding protein
MNVWTFSGNLGRDAALKHVGETTVAEFSVAVKSGWGDKATTTWVNCSYWGKRGEGVTPYLNKGQQVVVSGEARLHEYEKKDGTGTGKSMELRVNELTLVGGKVESSKPAEAKSGSFRDKPVVQDDGVGEDEIPF